MQSFTLDTPDDAQSAIRAAAAPNAMYIAGGTDLMQLIKDDIVAPARLVDIAGLKLDAIDATEASLHLGALARMSDVAAHPGVVAHYPVVAQALLASASPQLRNMGTMGGNMLQRTRCGYFRDTGSACNKRVPGSGCPAIAGQNRMLGILGTSAQCIATHPSDLAVALVALDATIDLRGADGQTRNVPLETFHVLPGTTPQRETILQPGALITGIGVAAPAPRSVYLKLRDRASFEFAVVSVAVAMELDGGTIGRVRIAAGGVAPKPWRLHDVEAALHGKPTDETTLRQAASLAATGAMPQSQNAYKLVLLQNAVFRALQTAIDGGAA